MDSLESLEADLALTSNDLKALRATTKTEETVLADKVKGL